MSAIPDQRDSRAFLALTVLLALVWPASVAASAPANSPAAYVAAATLAHGAAAGSALVDREDVSQREHAACGEHAADLGEAGCPVTPVRNDSVLTARSNTPSASGRCSATAWTKRIGSSAGVAALAAVSIASAASIPTS